MKTFQELYESQQSLNEGKFKGKSILPDWLDKDDFGKPVKSIRDLKEGSLYFIWEGGMDEWHGEYKYKFDKTAKEYLFDDYSNPAYVDPYTQMTFTKKEIEEYIKDQLIYNQI